VSARHDNRPPHPFVIGAALVLVVAVCWSLGAWIWGVR
jgi:hypothetical protein